MNRSELVSHDFTPPRCSTHSVLTGTPKGNSSAVKHGFYRRRVTADEFDSLFEEGAAVTLSQEAVLLRVLLHRLSDYLRDDELPIKEVKSISNL